MAYVVLSIKFINAGERETLTIGSIVDEALTAFSGSKYLVWNLTML